ncbi:hypothetical protein [Streptomyces griseorubiginosus]|uniref:hypothetical protein n=1 Tax=Streptomyces griseorubiginosus TaxID=67304 RepID=UPI0036E94105
MANQHSQKLRGIRGVDDALWTDLDHAAKAAGSDRSKVTRELWEWFVGRSGAQLPNRPPMPDAPRNDVADFLRYHIGESLRAARTTGSLSIIAADEERLRIVNEHEHEGPRSVTLRALADRYGGYHISWRPVGSEENTG